MEDGGFHIDKERRRGRAAASNRQGRFERFETERVDDGWEQARDLPPLRTFVSEERPRKMITYNASPDLNFDRSINPYRGCEHGCIYCFARPTHAFLGLSPGLDFETRLVARPNAPEVLERELRNRRYQPKSIAIGTNTDPYQPVEKAYEIMRSCLLVLERFNHPVGIVTKGALIERDLDILERLARKSLVRVGISVTTLDATLSRKMEPRVPAPSRRLETIRRLSEAGVDVRIMASPMVPGLSDHELEAILQAGAEAGASSASWIMLRLPLEVSDLFQDWLQEHYPNKAAKVMARLREMHGGQTYSATWHKRMRGEGHHAQLLAHRFALALKRFGLKENAPPLRKDLFEVPLARGAQLSLF